MIEIHFLKGSNLLEQTFVLAILTITNRTKARRLKVEKMSMLGHNLVLLLFQNSILFWESPHYHLNLFMFHNLFSRTIWFMFVNLTIHICILIVMNGFVSSKLISDYVSQFNWLKNKSRNKWTFTCQVLY